MDFLPGGGHRLGEVVPDHFQQTKTAFREVKKNADDIVLAIQTYPSFDLSHQALMTNKPGILWLRRCF
jgi:hypothetical protein